MATTAPTAAVTTTTKTTIPAATTAHDAVTTPGTATLTIQQPPRPPRPRPQPPNRAVSQAILIAVQPVTEGNCPNAYPYAFGVRCGTALWTCGSALHNDHRPTFCPCFLSLSSPFLPQ
ncbi:hypothetical protein BJV78DRAFT_531976 [Lactifluus subvellereus]|nr:hypothetical protein BJV78DRAFT_531976 [Lactifluus subvellereus]